jgi:acetyl esterase/lipase/hemerythrin-like domain-containing protein
MPSSQRVGKARRKAAPRGNQSVSRLQSEGRWDLPKPLLAILDEHRYVFRLLPLLEAEAAKLKGNRKADYERMEDIMHYMTHFPDRYHHPKEDLIFERMSGLAPDAAAAVSRLRKDHRKMAEQGEALLAAIVSQRESPDRVKASKLADDLCYYARALRAHMSLEEAEILEPARRSLKERDWREIDRAIAPIIDPVFGERISARYLDLVQDYINDFISVSASGSVPVRRLEAVAIKLEQAFYALGELGQLPKELARIRVDLATARFRQFGDLFRVRDRAMLRAWIGETRAMRRESWSRMVDQLKEVVDAVTQPLENARSHSELSTITLHTEQEILSFQERPYQPSRSPRISWQAALMNLVSRMTIKQMMARGDLSDLERSERIQKQSKLVPPGTRVQAVAEPGFHAVWILPERQTSATRTILHLPGGAFVFPASDMHRMMLAKLAGNTQTRVMLVNYRLLPRHPFPAGLEDALAAYRYLLNNGVKPGEIAVSGDSAGGCLALAMMLALRDEGLPLPAAGALFSPLTDLSFSTAARRLNRWNDSILPSNRKMTDFGAYAGDAACDNPLVSPIYGTFHGFPPMFALVSSTETLLDDTLVVARKARAQGVDFKVEVWENLPHAWPVFSFIPESGMALERVADFYAQHLKISTESTSSGHLRRVV